VNGAIRRVAVFCGSSPGVDPAWSRAAYDVGRGLAERGIGLVYGAGGFGLMREVSQGALDAGGEVIGVIPRSMVEREWGRDDLTETHVVETMHQRKAMMYELADAFVVAPGGLGTLEEAFEQLTGLYLGYHAKPIVFFDIDGFWPRLEAFLDHAVDVGMLRVEARALFRTASSVSATLDALSVW
jgi:uncharacterized protein (TIGR00730 family)